MIPFENALQVVMDCARPLGSQAVALNEALNRILAEDVKSDADMPPFNKSAMDGYACRRDDLAQPLTVVEVLAAGGLPTKTIGPNQCAKIMTGAMVPDGADCVIMVEMTQELPDGKVRFTGSRTANNICCRGEDVMSDEIVLRQGTRIGPQHIAILASVGCSFPQVACRARVGIIATGDELVEPQAKPGPSQIRNSNSFQLFAQTVRAGAEPFYYGIATDKERAIEGMVLTALKERDVVLISGGVSAGDFDLVPGILKKVGVELLLESIAVKPGKPTIFGRLDNTFFFGLPGNPVSTFIIFELLVKPFLYRMMGHDFIPPAIDLPLAKALTQKDGERETWVPVVIDQGSAVPVEFHGSAHIQALAQADGMVCIPRGVRTIEKGGLVRVRPI